MLKPGAIVHQTWRLTHPISLFNHWHLTCGGLCQGGSQLVCHVKTHTQSPKQRCAKEKPPKLDSNVADLVTRPYSKVSLCAKVNFSCKATKTWERIE